jgi:hypothetical protein
MPAQFAGDGDKSGEIVASEENILLYLTDVTSQGRKIYCALDRRDQPRQENILLYQSDETS